MVKHKINDHARNRHVEPERQSNPGNPAVPDEVMAKGAIKSERHERHDDDGENRVAGENREIEWAHPACSLKTRRAVVVVISEIGSEKQDRDDQCGYLASAMCGYIVRLDKSPARKQQDCAGPIQTRIKVWQIRDVLRHS